MDVPRRVRLPVVVPLEVDQVEAELDAAIALVAKGGARRIIVSGMPDLEALAAATVVRAQAAGIRFSLLRDESTGTISAIVGPREA